MSNGNDKALTVLLTGLSKTFNCLPHDLIIAKFNVYGFSLSSTIDAKLFNQIVSK